MSKTGKVWGSTTTLLKTPFIEIHKLNINPNSKCSLHEHTSKWNAFIVHSGKLYIEVEKRDYKLIDTTELGPGEFTTVKPGEYHRFVTKDEPVEAWEIYYPSELSEDIIRKDVGGHVSPVKTKPSEK